MAAVKKLVFLFAASLFTLTLSLFFSCEMPLFEEDDPQAVDVVWSEDWKFITIYLDGRTTKATPSVQRAMNSDTARRGFDYFEVVFCFGETVIRKTWGIGARVNIEGVPKNVNYSRTGITPGYGSALLFAGRDEKNHKTILAFGKIYSIDEVVGAYIMDDSAAVTFQVYPLNAGVSYSAAYSSFETAYGDTPSYSTATAANTAIIQALIGGRSFPMYRLRPGVQMAATYEFVLEGATWGEFPGVMLASANIRNSAGVIERVVAGVADKREARYPAGGGNYWYPKMDEVDETTVVRMLNNQMADVGKPVQNPIKFTIDTTATIQPFYEANGLFMLVFSIPVYNQIAIANAREEDLWFIKAAYQSYYYNIDNGGDSTGGGILMGVFDPNIKVFDVDRVRGV